MFIILELRCEILQQTKVVEKKTPFVEILHKY